jgi:hypothetical protein
MIFPLASVSKTSFEAHPASYPVGTRGPSWGKMRLGHDADHSTASSSEVNNE